MPSQSIQTVLGGPGGLSGQAAFDAACKEIFQEFEPPIVCGTYDEVRQVTAGTGQQAEHFVVNSALQTNRKANTSLAQFANYSQFTAFAYNVWDGQSLGTEHRRITDAAREFERANPHASVRQRLQAQERATAESLRDRNRPVKDASPRPRMKDPERPDNKELAEAAARCLTRKAEEHFEKQGVDLDAPTRNGLTGGAVPQTTVPPPKGPSVAE